MLKKLGTGNIHYTAQYVYTIQCIVYIHTAVDEYNGAGFPVVVTSVLQIM